MAETLLPGMDVDLGRELERAFGRQGITVLTGHRYESFARADTGARVVVAGPQGPRTLEAAQVLVAGGRGPLSAGGGAEDIGGRLVRGVGALGPTGTASA